MMSWKLAATVGRRPDLWTEAVRTLFAVSPRNWWKKAPFIPVPDKAYSDWRVATLHGSAAAELSPDELVLYLKWRKRQHRALGRV